MASPNPGGPSDSGHDDNYLHGVVATSRSNAWAVGTFNNGSTYQTLITRWDGSAWTVETSPNPGGTTNTNELNDVAAVSSNDAWAVGWYSDGLAGRSLILHWNGTKWRKVPSPSPPGGSSELYSVTATSATNAWAVGRVGSDPLIVRWNGSEWRRQASPNPSTNYVRLHGVAATSATDAWAVGYYATATDEDTLILHWDGSSWTQVVSPNPGSANDQLFAVSALAEAKAWAVGSAYDGGDLQTFVIRWNGTGWKRIASPNPAVDQSDDNLYGISALSGTDIWAVGDWFEGSVGRTLAMHCC